MKQPLNTVPLLKKISQKQLLFGLVIVLGSLIVLYFLTRAYIVTETEESLYHTSFRIEQRLTQNETVTSLFPLFEIHHAETLQPDTLKDTLIFDSLQNEDELFKELNTYKSINGKNYHLVTRTLLVEYDDTLFTILITFAVIIILVYLAQYAFNKSLNKTVWTPFFDNIEAIKKFSIGSDQPIQLQSSDILEFSELNTQIEALTSKVANDYQNLKQFTEDLSHEVQTPLSIIQAKIENLIDGSQHLDEDHLKTLYDIQKNAKRLSKLNKGLILLTKIENQQFNTLETVDTNILIRAILENIEDISNIKRLQINYQESASILLQMDRVIADILFSNLIGNAIKHTEKQGKISILIENGRFTISNSGKNVIPNAQYIFNRFYKGSEQSHSLGLGLAIVKKICDYYGFTIQYHFKDDHHHFQVIF